MSGTTLTTQNTNITPFMLVCVHYKMQEKKKKKSMRQGQRFFLFCIQAFMSVDLIPSVSHQPLWQCGLVGGWGRKNEFETAGIDRFKYDFPMCFFAY